MSASKTILTKLVLSTLSARLIVFTWTSALLLLATDGFAASKGGSKDTIPAAPANLTASAISSNQIVLRWIDTSSNESGFKIERAPTASGAWKQIATTSGNVVSFANTGLSPLTTYYYRVRAFSSRGNSSYTDVAGATTPAAAAIPCTYAIATSSAPSAGGTASGSGTVDCGSIVTVTAVASAGYNFLNWTENGAVVSTTATYSFTASANRSLVATFVAIPCTYEIVTSTSASGGGTTGGGGTVSCGSVVTVFASAVSGYNFVSWTEGGVQVSTSASYTFSANSSRSLVATFAAVPCTYLISTASSGGGTISGGGTFNCGSTVTLSAVPASCYRFVSWSEAGSVVSSSASYTFTASSSRSLTANFSSVTYSISPSVSTSGGGVVSGGGILNCGATATVNANPNSGYSFVNWTEAGIVVSSVANYSFAVSANRSPIANFAALPCTYTINASTSPSGGGQTSGSGTVSCGSTVTVSAIASAGYNFVNWTESGVVVSGSANYTFTANASRSLTANFAPCTYAISTSTPGGGTVSGGGTFNCGSSVTVNALAASCYGFVSWTENGLVVSTSPSYTFTAGASRSLSANFTPNTYSISAGSSPLAGGTTSGGGTFNCGSSVTVNAVPASCFRFVNWSEGGTVVSSSASYTFTANTSRNLTANFAQVTYAISASVSLAGSGTVSGGGTVNCGAIATVTASPASCYSFVNWTENGVVVSSSAVYSFAPSGNRNLVANFSINRLTVTTSSSPSAGGVTSGGGTVNCGSSINVIAAATTGYSFLNWSENGVAVSTTANYTFTANGSRNLVANFSAVPCSFSLSASSASFGAATGNGNVTVNASSGTCNWGASTSFGWIHTSSSGTGTGNANYSIDANTSLSARFGSLIIAGQNFTISQWGHTVPVANAGQNQTVNAGTAVSFSGSASTVSDGAVITSYNWAFGDLASASGVSVAHTYSAAGTYVATLTVTDSYGATASSTVTITVNSVLPPLTVSLTVPAAGATVANTVTLSASASSAATRVEFYCNNVTSPLGSSVIAPFAIACDTTVMPNGAHSFYCKAYDATGRSVTSAAVEVTVNNTTQVAGSWAKRFGGAMNDSGSAVAVDGSGNILMAGYFKGTADFGGSLFTSAGGADMFLAKYSNAGVHQWSLRFGTTGDETVKAIALDASGNIFVAGYFTGSGNFGGSTFTGAGQYNAFVAKYSASGQHLWSKSFGSTSSTTYIDLFNALAVDSLGNVVVTGTFQGDASFGGPALRSQWGTAVNTVLAKYSNDGTHLWSKTFTSGNENYANSIAIDRNDNILLVGSFFTSVNFASNDGLDQTITTVYPTYQNIFVAKFTKDGSHIWSKRYGGPKGDKGLSVAVDGNGDVLVGGMFYKQTDLGNGTIYGGAVDLDSFVAKYSGLDGSYRWAAPITGNNGCWVNSVKADAQNNVVLMGFFYGTFNFGGQSLSSTLNSYDGYVAKYSSSGNLTWISAQGGNGSDGGTSMTIDATSHPIITGAFNGSALIDGNTLISAGMGDTFLLRLNP